MANGQFFTFINNFGFYPLILVSDVRFEGRDIQITSIIACHTVLAAIVDTSDNVCLDLQNCSYSIYSIKVKIVFRDMNTMLYLHHIVFV